MRPLLPALLLSLIACSRSAPPPPPADPSWAASVEHFRVDRARAIGGPDGWMSLVGRFTLKNGANTVGADPRCAAVLPTDRAPALLGTINVEAGTLYFTTAEGAEVKVKGQSVKTLTLADDSAGKPTVLEAGSLRLHVLKRGSQFMLRAKDRQYPGREAFKGLDWYPLDTRWRVKARFEPSPPGTTVPILNVLNQTEAQPSPGHVAFEVDGQTHRLVALQEDDELFIIFKDATANVGTYPSGRFLDTPRPGADGLVDLDFNRAYSPPCAFTTFATCPIPPRENHLGFKVEAGERYSGSHR